MINFGLYIYIYIQKRLVKLSTKNVIMELIHNLNDRLRLELGGFSQENLMT